MKNYLLTTLLLSILFFAHPFHSNAEYVMPYPSEMPGSRFYNLSEFWSKVMRYWNFGNIASFKYNLSLSDKYLIEAKVLFEYKQYLLAYESLDKSNSYFLNTQGYLKNAELEGKNVIDKYEILSEASSKHIEILNKIKADTPENFNWIPEKDDSSFLNIHKLIEKSIKIRKDNL